MKKSVLLLLLCLLGFLSHQTIAQSATQRAQEKASFMQQCQSLPAATRQNIQANYDQLSPEQKQGLIKQAQFRASAKGQALLQKNQKLSTVNKNQSAEQYEQQKQAALKSN